MTSPAPSHHSLPPEQRRLPIGTAVTAGVLLAIPILALVIVPIYAHDGPRLWGWPFFYWYQVVWTVVGSLFTYAAYVVVKRARPSRSAGRGGRNR